MCDDGILVLRQMTN